VARILVVDDDPDVLKLVEKVLSMNHHQVFTASDAMKAMDLMNASLYDLLISDANMPRFSGFDLVSTIKNNRRLDRMAVAMLTGLRERKDIEKAIRAGVDDYIVKPIDPMLLMQKVEALFEKKPPMERAEFNLPETYNFAEATAALEMRITNISETGLVLKSPIEIPAGLNVIVASDLFRKMDIPVPNMKVISCRKMVEFHYDVKIAFLNINDKFCSKVRAWIHKHDPNSKRKDVA
jgi:CheY-like chemotaxis protein